MNNLPSSSLIPISPSLLFNEGFELSDQNIIPHYDLEGSFDPEEDIVEFHIYDENKNHLSSNYNFKDWSLNNTSTSPKGNTEQITSLVLNPEEDIYNEGYANGSLYGVYNFINYKLNSNSTFPYFIAEISSDRTEISIKSNTLSQSDMITKAKDFKRSLKLNPSLDGRVVNSLDYLDEFYLSFGFNEYIIGVNVDTKGDDKSPSVLIKLYQPLPPKYDIKDKVSIITKVGETRAFKVSYSLDLNSLNLDPKFYLRGPNTNLDIKDFVNNFTTLKSKDELLSTNSTSSKYNLSNVLNEKGVKISPNYSYDTFDQFINFSSSKSRINNFYKKVSQIQSYQDDIDTLSSVDSSSITITILKNRIEDVIKNFDGYEYYQYYDSSSFSYPKTGSSFPYTLKAIDDSEVLTWLGSDIENSQYYGGYVYSASLYDENNQNWLWYTIPEFIKENEDNGPYIDFCNMVGQHFDQLWLYTKALSERYNTTNTLDQGLPLDLILPALKSLGFEVYGSNLDSNNYINSIGEDNKYYTPSTGSELITDYIAVNVSGSIPNVDITSSYPYPTENIPKEILKRLYHNMSYLLKKKGTVSGLRQLINIWGIPDTILRISEFGGKDRDQETFDLWYNRFSYAYRPNLNATSSSSLAFPWAPLQRNFIHEGSNITPNSIAFRFKSDGIPSESHYTQSLLVKTSNTSSQYSNFGLVLTYNTGSTEDYLGSGSLPYSEYGTLNFHLDDYGGGSPLISPDIYLPFFNKGWWSILLQRDIHSNTSASIDTYTLYAKNNQYNGYDGNIIGFQSSSSLTVDGATTPSYNLTWYTSSYDPNSMVYLGGRPGGALLSDDSILNPSNIIFSGSFQEFRYYSYALSESVFNSYVMNPESIEGNNFEGVGSSFDMLNFRAPLGNELENSFISTGVDMVESFTSKHPSIQGQTSGLITSSFRINSNTSSNYNIIYYNSGSYREGNNEVYFLNQPAVGVRNRISDKIRVVTTSSYGNLLSNHKSIQQDYPINNKYTEDISTLEVGFSPQNEINDNIIQTYGDDAISNILGDPRSYTSSLQHYPELKALASKYFEKYTKGNLYDYIRLIKYYDNSLFKTIKSYVPARTKVDTGLIIKQHLLERNRVIPPQATSYTEMVKGINWQNLEITSSINDLVIPSGGAGGTVNSLNNLEYYTGSFQEEFYDGEYSGSEFQATTQSLFNNPYSSFKGEPIFYHTLVTASVDYTEYPGKSTDYYISGRSEENMETLILNASSSVTSIVHLFKPKTEPFQYVGGIAFRIADFPGLREISNNPEIQNWRFSPFYTQNAMGPYFRIDLNGVFDSTNSRRDSIESGIISSPFLGNLKENYLFEDTTGGGKPYPIWRIIKPISPLSTPWLSNGASIALGNYNTSSDIYVSSFQSQQLNHISTSDLSQGTASINLYGLSYYGTGSDIAQWAPTSIVFNKFSQTGSEVINNSNTLVNFPSFNISLDHTGTPISQDVNNLQGNVISNQYLNLNVLTGNENNIGFIYSHLGRVNSGSTDFVFSETPQDIFYNFSPYLPSNFNFSNSDYNPLLNNSQGERKNTYKQKIEYSFGIETPSNLSKILLNKAEKAEVPDSSYTSQKITLPRYLGSKLSSLDYNNYSSQSISYSGDISYGQTSVIDIYPKYFAHFKKSYLNLNVDRTYVFEIDSLIPCPNSPLEESTGLIKDIKLEGNNTYLFEVNSSFEHNRKALITYEDSNFESIDYSELDQKAAVILQGALQYETIGATTTGLYGPSIASWPNFTGDSYLYFITSSFQQLSSSNSSGDPLAEAEGVKLSGSWDWLMTGSSMFYLGGDYTKTSQTYDPLLYPGETIEFWGPGLGLIQSINTNIYLNQKATSSDGYGYLGVPTSNGEIINSFDLGNKNYYYFDFETNLIEGYLDNKIPFMIMQGDEIRVSFEPSGNTGVKNIYTSIDFLVTSVEGTDDVFFGDYHCKPSNDSEVDVSSSSLHHIIKVHPDPSTLNIPNGKIDSFTIRRRKNSDTKIIIYQTPPSGALGISQYSEGGFIIPHDFSEQQKENVQPIINQLRSKNSFK
jgi:hypothetical protein